MKKYILGLLLLANVAGQLYNNCMSFTIRAGTGCIWMCEYCANILRTNNYYFTNGICTYQTNGCFGYPLADVNYTCCSQ